MPTGRQCSKRVLHPLDGCLQLCKAPVSVVGQRDQHPDGAQEIFPVDVDDEHGAKTKTFTLSIRDAKSRQFGINTLRMLGREGAICRSGDYLAPRPSPDN